MKNKTTRTDTHAMTVQQAFSIALEYFQDGNLCEAKSLCNKILMVDTKNHNCYNLLGIIESKEGRYEKSIILFKQAISLKSDFTYFYNLGNSFKSLCKLNEAEVSYRSAIKLEPKLSILYYHLGMILREQRKYKEATDVFEDWVSIEPSNPESLLNLGSILAEQNENDKSIEYYTKVLALDSTHQSALYSLAVVLGNQGRIGEAKQIFDKLISLYPYDAIKIKSAWQVPIIASSTQELLDWRYEFLSKIDELINARVQVPDPLVELGKTNFYLAFQGFDNRQLISKVADLLVIACPSLTWTAPHCLVKYQPKSRIRVGFISNYFHLHSIGKTSRGLIAELSRDKFEVHSLFVPPIITDPIYNLIQDSSDYCHILPASLSEARETIADLELDILFYQDIGMEPFTYYLAFSRLAPVQCVSFGHPDTTGINNIDYFISTEYSEIADAELHYTEKLVKLCNVAIPAYYYPPYIDMPLKNRRYYGISDHDNFYFCPQTLFKFHPDFDIILSHILSNDNQGIIVCLEAHIPNWTALLKQRFLHSIGKNADRIVFLPRQSFGDYLNLLAVADVILDTIYFNGMNTTLEAFSVGTPVVTLPGQHQRGRHTFAMYRRMEINECIATDPADYTRRAIRVANDKKLRNDISQKIIENKALLFEDSQVVKQVEDFFISALNNL